MVRTAEMSVHSLFAPNNLSLHATGMPNVAAARLRGGGIFVLDWREKAPCGD
jgi:hypothetical protein